MTGMHFDAIVNANGNSKKYLAEQDPQLDYEMSVESVSRSLADFRFETYVFISSVMSTARRTPVSCVARPTRRWTGRCLITAATSVRQKTWSNPEAGDI